MYGLIKYGLFDVDFEVCLGFFILIFFKMILFMFVELSCFLVIDIEWDICNGVWLVCKVFWVWLYFKICFLVFFLNGFEVLGCKERKYCFLEFYFVVLNCFLLVDCKCVFVMMCLLILYLCCFENVLWSISEVCKYLSFFNVCLIDCFFDVFDFIV